VRRDGVLLVEVEQHQVTYSLVRGEEPLVVRHEDEDVEVRPGEAVLRPLRRRPDGVPPPQPAGRAPARRRRG